MPKLSGRTLIISDNSGSMNDALSKNSTLTYKDIGSLMMAISNKFCDESVCSVFGDNFKLVNVSSRNGVLSNMKAFKNTNVGFSTRLYTAFDWLLTSKQKFDRIIVFSDMQCYGRTAFYEKKNANLLLAQYKKTVNPNCWLHSVDLAGYGTVQFVGENVNLVAGWSEKILQFISMAEQGGDNMSKTVSNYWFK
jgi:hypothetical protein